MSCIVVIHEFELFLPTDGFNLHCHTSVGSPIRLLQPRSASVCYRVG